MDQILAKYPFKLSDLCAPQDLWMEVVWEERTRTCERSHGVSSCYVQRGGACCEMLSKRVFIWLSHFFHLLRETYSKCWSLITEFLTVWFFFLVSKKRRSFKKSFSSGTAHAGVGLPLLKKINNNNNYHTISHHIIHKCSTEMRVLRESDVVSRWSRATLSPSVLCRARASYATSVEKRPSEVVDREAGRVAEWHLRHTTSCQPWRGWKRDKVRKLARNQKLINLLISEIRDAWDSPQKGGDLHRKTSSQQSWEEPWRRKRRDISREIMDESLPQRAARVPQRGRTCCTQSTLTISKCIHRCRWYIWIIRVETCGFSRCRVAHRLFARQLNSEYN